MTQTELKETRQSILFMCLLTLKSIIIAMIIGFGFLFAILNIRSAEAATLKPVALVNDDVVRLGDLFEDAGEKADVVIGKAPQPGKDMTVSARNLMRIAAAHQIAWTADSSADQVTIKRDVHTISSMDIQDAVKGALEARGVEGSYSVILNDLRAAMTLPRNLPATAEVTNLNYTPGRDSFTATVAAPSADNPVKTVNISGTIERTVLVPTMKSTIKSGDIIGSTDLEWIDVAQRNLAADAIIDADDLIGKTPVRVLSVGQPVRMKDVSNPQLVARGDEITIIFKSGSMQLTAKGKAMQNGAEGDIVRAVNVATNRSLTAMVTADRTVTVQ